MAESFPRLSARTRRFTLGEPRAFTISADGSRVLFLRALSGTDARTGLWLLDVAAGTERLVVDPASLADDADLPAAERARRERVRETATGVVAYSADDAGRVAAFAAAGALWVVDVDDAAPRMLETPPGVYDPRLDPTGRWVGYVVDRDLRICAVDGSEDRTLAADLDPAVSWGRAEFAAAEEMERTRGFWWAPDGSALLAARVDETDVPTYWIAQPSHPDQPPTAVRYPAAGCANADVTLHVVRLDGATTPVQWDRERCPYLARVAWAGDRPPVIQVQTRDQRETEFRAVDSATGTTDLLYADRDDVWTELFPGAPTWHRDELVRIVDGDARALLVGDTAVTDESFYLRSVVGADDGAVVLTASEDEPAEVHVYRWTRSGGVERLTGSRGVHGAAYGGGTIVLTATSMEHDGSRTVVRRGDSEIEIASHAEKPPFMPAVRLLRLGSRDLPSGLLFPTGHEPGTPVPVLMDPYGGPHAQRVLAGRRVWLEPQWWADQGFAVLVVDGRGTPGRDPGWERMVHHDLATAVLDDQVDALQAAAKEFPDLDLSRVAIRGWSFGGYLAALAVLRRPDVFHAAVAGAPCTEWTLYDTHYTERYLGHPRDNAAVYREHSLLPDAEKLSRPLLLIHGLADDNVLSAHTLQLSQRLTEAGRPHSVLPLTGVTHMTPQEAVAENLMLLQLEFLGRHLSLR
jgi:dipeptidyl-peptidase-4